MKKPSGDVCRWSTDAVAPAARLDYWVGAVCECFLEMQVASAAPGAFSATLESAPLDILRVNRVTGSGQHVFRTRSAIARSDLDYFYLLVKPDAPWAVEQAGRGTRLLPGDAVLIDSRRCYGLHFESTVDALSLELPIGWVERWLVQSRDHVACRIDGQAGWGAVLSRYAQQLTPELAQQAPLPTTLLSDQLGALLALACGAHRDGPTDAGDTGLRHRILDAIRARHGELGLTARLVAETLGISERTLHRSLAAAGQTFGAALLDSRMRTARELLMQPRFDRLTIAEIGYRAGFADPSHFVRQCRRHLGATPGRVRGSRP
ncbi:MULTISPECIES: helix-turn-helix domain-containing protein [Ralstonia solanacearum species complex]|uniref:helix-turn-helix domain-containing protein n=1 Tax=Ralstonia solanacearum species complex TaxID=3116862 RepID=UPI00078C6D0C|nr:helix-turn-helix domain-containing protein [Ralstonia solanacearum]AMP38074.1 AraC family transcriptional regulator [Ralstonia solanacearum]BEU72630.1 hypothetical protein MAFF211271_21850 [Ralstonia pseudosolanacearum]